MGFNTNLSIKKWRTKILRAKRGERPDLKVSFIVGGAQKSGTTALDFVLRQHPEICMPHTGKEIHFFDNEKNFINKFIDGITAKTKNDDKNEMAFARNNLIEFRDQFNKMIIPQVRICKDKISAAEERIKFINPVRLS